MATKGVDFEFYRLCLSARYFSCLAISSFLFLLGELLVISSFPCTPYIIMGENHVIKKVGGLTAAALAQGYNG